MKMFKLKYFRITFMMYMIQHFETCFTEVKCFISKIHYYYYNMRLVCLYFFSGCHYKR